MVFGHVHTICIDHPFQFQIKFKYCINVDPQFKQCYKWEYGFPSWLALSEPELVGRRGYEGLNFFGRGESEDSTLNTSLCNHEIGKEEISREIWPVR